MPEQRHFQGDGQAVYGGAVVIAMQVDDLMVLGEPAQECLGVCCCQSAVMHFDGYLTKVLPEVLGCLGDGLVFGSFDVHF